jgi:hypothetical protein
MTTRWVAQRTGRGVSVLREFGLGACRSAAEGIGAHRTTLVYSGLLAAGSVGLATRDAVARLSWLQWASTNLDNLEHHPVAAVVLSAFLTEDHPVAWVAFALVGLGGTERALGAARTAILVAGGHLIGTAVSEGVLAYRVHAGRVPVDQRHIIDVGPSFVVVTALLAAVLVGRPLARVVCAGCFAVLAPDLFGGLTRLDVAALGHACAAVIGTAGGWALKFSAPDADEKPVTPAIHDPRR